MALEYLAESARELRFGLLRDILEKKVPIEDAALAQILAVLPADVAQVGIDAIDPVELQARLRTLAAAYAAINGLRPMILPLVEIDDETRLAAAREVEKNAMILRCADYARRAQDAPPEAQAQAIKRLTHELSALAA